MQSLLRGNPRPIPEDAPRWRRQLHAIWWGYRMGAGPQSAEDVVTDTKEAPPPLEAEVWTVPRVVAVQTIFGEGMVGPGGEQAFIELVRPCSLNSQKSAVEIGASLGALARWAHEDTGTYFKAFEPDEELSKAGDEISTRKGLGRKAPVERVAFDKIELRAKSQDTVLSKESFHRVADLGALMAKIHEILKPNGLLSFSTYILNGGPQDAKIDEAFPGSRMYDAEAMRAIVAGPGLDIRVFEDRTAAYVKSAIDAFAGFAAKVQAGAASDPMRDAVVREGEIWAPRIGMMQSGRIKVYRVLANKLD